MDYAVESNEWIALVWEKLTSLSFCIFFVFIRTELHLNHFAENNAFGIMPQTKVDYLMENIILFFFVLKQTAILYRAGIFFKLLVVIFNLLYWLKSHSTFLKCAWTVIRKQTSTSPSFSGLYNVRSGSWIMNIRFKSPRYLQKSYCCPFEAS